MGRSLYRAGDDTSCITRSTLYTTLNLFKFSSLLEVSELRSCGSSSSAAQEWQRHRHTKRVVKPCCMTCKYSFPETTYFLWNCAFLFQMKGRASSDWWGQSACNKLVSYFTVQPLKRLVKCTSGSAPFLNDMCVFRGPMVWTCSFDGSGTIQRDLWFCSGIRVPTHSCSSVKRGEAGGGEMCNPHSQNSSPPTQIWCEPI